MARSIWLASGLVLLQGCVSLNVDTAPIAAALPGLASQYAPGKPASVPATSPGAVGVCANGAVPASGAYIGAATLGQYAGVALPASFTVYQAEQDITDRISGFAEDPSPQGTSTWTAFQCLYPAAVAAWRYQQAAQAAAVPINPIEQLPAAVAPVDEQCPAIINPANGTMNGTPEQGVYEGALLPGSFAAYNTEEAITQRISQFAADDSEQGRNTWFKFQCYYAQAVAAWQQVS